MDLKEILGLVAVLITLIGYFQYFRTIFKGQTKPHMFSWLIWATLTAIAFFAQWSDNAGPGAWVTAVTALISFIIVGVAAFNKEKSITKGDWITFIAGLSAIPIWLLTEDALFAIIIVTIIDALGFYPTFRKSWHNPHEEALAHYLLAGLKFALALIALENFTTVTALYPLSLVVANWVFVAMALYRRKALA